MCSHARMYACRVCVCVCVCVRVCVCVCTHVYTFIHARCRSRLAIETVPAKYPSWVPMTNFPSTTRTGMEGERKREHAPRDAVTGATECSTQHLRHQPRRLSETHTLDKHWLLVHWLLVHWLLVHWFLVHWLLVHWLLVLLPLRHIASKH